jgi:hypothetical protein
MADNSNPFDQFDAQGAPVSAQGAPTASGNPFDQFDAAGAPAPAQAATASTPFDQAVQQQVQIARSQDSAAGPAPTPGMLDTALQSVQDYGNAAAHHLANIPVGALQLGANAASKIADSLLPATSQERQLDDAAAQRINQNVAQREAQYQATTPTNKSSIAGATTSEILPWMLGIGEAKAAGYIPEATTYLGKIGQGALTGGAIAATQPVSTPTGSGQTTLNDVAENKTAAPTYVDQKLKQIGLGAVTGGAIPAVTGAPGAILRTVAGNMSPETAQLAQRAQQLGIDLNAPQVSDSVPLKVANSVTSQLPFSGAASAAAKQQGQFNQAVARTIGLADPITNDAPKAITPDVFQQAVQKASQGFNDLWSRNNMNVTPQVLKNLTDVANQAQQVDGPDSGQALNGVLDRVAKEASNGTLPGRNFQTIDTLLGKMQQGGGQKAYWAGEMQDALRDGMQQSMSPADQSALSDLRGTWQNIKTLTPLVAKASGNDGNISPGALMGAVTSNGVGKNAVAQGTRGDLADLAAIGQRFLKQQIPDSGTAIRSHALDAIKTMGGVASGAPLVGGPAAVGATAATLGTGRALQALLRSRAMYNALGQTQGVAASPTTNALGIAASQYAINPPMQAPATQQ